MLIIEKEKICAFIDKSSCYSFVNEADIGYAVVFMYWKRHECMIRKEQQILTSVNIAITLFAFYEY